MQRKLWGIVLAVSVLLVGVWGVASAESFRSGNTTTVGAKETINETLWISGRTVDIAGQINGDVFCAGQNVTVSGTVRGDVLCAAQTITISGTVTGDVRLLAQTATMGGVVEHSVSAATQSFSQSSKSTIRGDASIASSDISLNGSVGRDAALAADTIALNGTVGREVQASTNTLSLSSSAKIGGDLSYTSANTATLAKGATVAGKTTKYQPQEQTSTKSMGSVFGFGLWSFLYVLGAALLLSLILVLLFPQAIHATAAQGLRSPWRVLLVGFLAALIVPALIILAMLTIIGIPLGLVLLGLWILLQVFAGVVAAYFLGRLVWRRQRNVVITMLVGVILLTVLYFIPVVGLFAFVAATLLGVGMILTQIKRQRPATSYTLADDTASTKR